MAGVKISRRALGVLSIFSALGTGLLIIEGWTLYERLNFKPPERDPNWFIRRSGSSIAAYRIADTQPELLSTLPCYCGCQDFRYPHQSLLECYKRPGGGYEEHGSLCSICQGEVFDADRWRHMGLPIEEIRQRIDEKWRGSEPEVHPPGASGHGTHPVLRQS